MSNTLALNLAAFFTPAKYSQKAIASPIIRSLLMVSSTHTKYGYIGQIIKLKNRQHTNIV